MKLNGRKWQLYYCDCPPDWPCTPEQCAEFKAFVDSRGGPDGESSSTEKPKESGRVRRLKREVQRWVDAGMPRTPPHKLQERHSKCFACPNYKEDKCVICMCPMTKMSLTHKTLVTLATGVVVPPKTEMATAECPERSKEYPNGRWQALVVLDTATGEYKWQM